MWKTIAVVGATAAIIGGAGTAAVAASETTTPTPSASSSSSASDHSANGAKTEARKKQDVDRLRRAVHATWVTENKKTLTFTTHDAIRGRVTAVSATSITVQAADNVTETYVLNSGTTVRTRASKTAASITDVKTGDPVWVAGTGTTTLTASRVVDAKKVAGSQK
ncbi:MAG: hypothetical protein ACYDDW_17235 [Dermatophilaceae bacterium]